MAAGVCHSDLHFWEGDVRSRRRQAAQAHRSRHDAAAHHGARDGRRSRGASARTPGASTIGDRRLVYPWIGCGACKVCTRGDEQLCLKPRLRRRVPSGRIQRSRAGAASALSRRLSATLPPEQAAPLACSGVTAYGALRKLGGLVQTEPVVIIGAGGCRPHGRSRSSSSLGGTARSSSISIRRKREHAEQAGRARGDRRERARCRASRSPTQPAARSGRWSISSARRSTVQTRHRCLDQGRQADRGRSVRRRDHPPDACSCRPRR